MKVTVGVYTGRFLWIQPLIVLFFDKYYFFMFHDIYILVLEYM